MLVIGVDPGLTGAISLLCSERGLLECEDLPTCGNGQETGKMLRWIDANALQAMLREWSVGHGFAEHSVHACIERPIPMPTLPAQTVASQFDTFGVIRALVSGKVAPDGMTIINPRDWKKLFGLGTDKNASRETALRLYPEAPVKLVKHHNRAEAILIGHWLLREVS
ncbi:MAG: hypothetical protein HXX19_11835 [Rhodoferax sp.]|nr:hypothetical protein [Rhodoferax sp.]